MQLTPPKHWVFWVSVVLVVLGLVGGYVFPALGLYDIWLVVVGYVLLALGNLLKDF